MSNKNAQDWMDLLAGQSVANADPKTVRDAQICRGALLAHADRLKNDAGIPYPHLLKNVLSRLEIPPQPTLTKSLLSDYVESPTAVINLNQWLQDNFVGAIKTGWLTLEDILCPTIPAVAFRGAPTNHFKGKKIKRAKQIQLGEEYTVVLVIELEEQDNQEIRILMRLSSTGTESYLPENIKFKVIPELGEPLEEVAGIHYDYLEQEWFYEKGERFRVVVALNGMSVAEDFEITSTTNCADKRINPVSNKYN
ncbi:MAG: hypothetical protein DRR08_10390 [Candidatus Parabeggiatoa sp. nov. 2]|nr:MAG: hypothetical protein B6247_26345 [Beggiatoa sp. 4572_84]RKZ60786.1 MAG: hypothetical protein DRR08_10390 [Gammaproteobacteria bacterium]HEC86027.1 DUF1822 family protein [Thioploca sp.]